MKNTAPPPFLPPHVLKRASLIFCASTVCSILIGQRIDGYRNMKEVSCIEERKIKRIERSPENLKPGMDDTYQKWLKYHRNTVAILEGYKWTAKIVNAYDKMKGRE